MSIDKPQAPAKKQYIYPHRHCQYCGRLIEVKGRAYCLKCRPEYQKEQSKIRRSSQFQKAFMVYIAFIIVLFMAIILYYG